MKNYSNGLGLAALVLVFFCRMATIDAMPGLSDTTTSSDSSGMPGAGSGMPTTTVPTAPTVPTLNQLDQRVTTDLAKLRKQSSIDGYLNTLTSILNYVGTQFVSPQTQLAYSNAVTNFDIYARRFLPSSISNTQISQMINFLSKFQNSTLIYSNSVNYVPSAITFWINALNNYGLSSYQKSIQRQQPKRNR